MDTSVINAYEEFGKIIHDKIRTPDDEYEAVCRQAYLRNNWFTRENVDHAFLAWSSVMINDQLKDWLSRYTQSGASRRVGVINAGNIPLVGLHDLLSVLAAGHFYVGKNASDDSVLLPYAASVIARIEPALGGRIQFAERLSDFDAVIATGSNNSARYFENYFARVPHIIRKNRNGAGVLTGNESGDQLKELGKDIFQYFGLGCRNVSKLYVPHSYDFKRFFEAMYDFNEVMKHHKYMNNFDYNNAMLLMKQLPFLQNNFLIIREDLRISSPIAVVHYERYSDLKELSQKLDESENQIQCIVAGEKLETDSGLTLRTVGFGQTQSPALTDYADGVDTMKFLTAL